MLKKDIKKECQRILHTGKILYSNTDDFNFLMNVFKGHSSWIDKMGCGIDCISIKETQFGTRCFWLHRSDGSETDISYIESMRPSSKKDKIISACRNSIKDIISDFKNVNYVCGETKCPFTGEILYDDTVHVDHYNLTFNEVFNNWISTCTSKGHDVEVIYNYLEKHNDGDTEERFKESGFKYRDSFVKYHNKYTNLRIVSKKANLGILKNRKK